MKKESLQGCFRSLRHSKATIQIGSENKFRRKFRKSAIRASMQTRHLIKLQAVKLQRKE